MAEKGVLDRRTFLVRAAGAICGSFLGLNLPSRSYAFSGHDRRHRPRACLALIIDDIGYSLAHARRFLQLDLPLTFSILPRLAYSYDLALEIRAKGHEVMLHQPMEPYNPRIDPGPGALYVGYEPVKIWRIMAENISEFPFSIGVNNHMGSRFTASQPEIKEALRVVKRKGLFFIDSLTSSHSRAFETARRLHMPSAARNLFLDNRARECAIVHQLYRLTKQARRTGRAIGIGHPHPATARAIGRFKGILAESGVSLVPVSRVVTG